MLHDWVGLRPGRTRLRLEADALAGLEGYPAATAAAGAGRGPGASSLPVIHNYGHGGAGLTLAWGCAGDVVRLLAQRLPSRE